MAEDLSGLMSQVGKATNVFGNVINAGTGLAGTLLSGKQNLSDYSNALSQNTDLLGKAGSALGNLVNGLVQFAEGSLQEYQALTQIGATFGKSLVDLKVSATELGLTVEEMIGFFKENNEGLRSFGGTTEVAIKRFKQLSLAVLDSEQGLGTELRRLGYTAGEINEGLMLFGEVTARNSRRETMSIQQQAQSAQGLLVQMDGLSKLTGESRKQLADEMKERRRQGDVAAFLAGKTSEEQAAFSAQLLQIQKTLGKNAADAFVDVALRGAPTTKETTGALLAMGNGAEEIYAAARAFNSGSISEFNNYVDGAISSAAEYQKTDEFKNAAILGGVNDTTAAFADASAAAYNLLNQMDATAEGDETVAQTMQRLDRQIKEEQYQQMKTTTGALEKTIQLQEAVRDMTKATMKEAMPRLENAALQAIEKVQSVLPTSEQLAQQVGGAIDKLFSAAEGKLGGGVNDDLINMLQNMFNPQDDIATNTEQTAANTGAMVEETVDAAEQQIEQEKITQDRIDEAQAELTEAQADLAELTNRQTDLVEAGIHERANDLQNDIDNAQAAVNAAEANLSTLVAQKAAETQRSIAEAQQYTANKISQYNSGGFFSGGFAEGGTIPSNGFGLVGENGPEFISGPANIMGTKTSMGVMNTLMKSIRNLETTVQDAPANTEKQVSNTTESQSFDQFNVKLDTMNGLLSQLVNVETSVATTQRRTYKATKGLQGNMMRGVTS